LKLRKESYKQYSGKINEGKIQVLKNENYRVLNVTLDGDAPKQYIKSYFYSFNCPRKSNPKSWKGYYAKFGSKSYPHESVIEYVINKIGESLGLKMNETKLVIINGQIRFLSKDFINKGKRLIHGTEILAEYFEDKDFIEEINKDRKKRRELLTFDEVVKALNYVYKDEASKLIKSLIQLITFDAIVGNNDRHFYNWGVIGDITRDEKNPVEFAPIYDSARGLLWNESEEEVIRIHNQSLTDISIIDGYCNRSKPRFSFIDNPKGNHFELISYLLENDSYRKLVVELTSEEMEELALQKLTDTVSSLFSHEREQLMLKVLSRRFEKIRDLI